MNALRDTLKLDGDYPLSVLVRREGQSRRIDIDGAVAISVSANAINVRPAHKDTELHEIMDRPLIHQMDSRALGSDLDYPEIKSIWEQKLRLGRRALESELEAIFRTHDLTIRYQPDMTSGRNTRRSQV